MHCNRLYYLALRVPLLFSPWLSYHSFVYYYLIFVGRRPRELVDDTPRLTFMELQTQS